ncbi:YkoF family thiamine/hydroxymethylpyrimidine-binding protein [Anoxynatronum sibiricum]|uniref:YkoF family thiamine/hydroxymethylpyrimidine-binding protein n=1 Tax=Anoxynatronum sibiricum TaxID=210623 RepID=A0ABU9VPG8_9CLOT
MCALAKTVTGTCQLAFLPLETTSSDAAVEQVLQIIESSGLEAEVGPVSTLIRGDAEALCALIQRIYKTMDDSQVRFSMNLLISNKCGCRR